MAPDNRSHCCFWPHTAFFPHRDGGDIINFMAQKNVKFVATKTVQKPATVKFKTKSGETVSFRALKTFEQKKVVRFRARKK
jgi:hypothetical protein